MSFLELLPFQAKASEEIVKRFNELRMDPRRPWENQFWKTPFYQALAAITGAGKTAILADTVAQLRACLDIEPLILWISKGKAVVDQTFANFQSGGKYAHLIDGFIVSSLADISSEKIMDDHSPHIILATVGTFNQKDKSKGSLRVHQIDEDKSSNSIWNLLKERKQSKGIRKPLIIVYDEGHNLSDQQTDLLLELEPDVILVSSATMRIPSKLGRIIDRLNDYGWEESKLVTTVSSKDVVLAELVKQQIVLGGYATSMEAALNDMLDMFDQAYHKVNILGLDFTPKAIYVSRTNISQEDGLVDNPSRPFDQRQAPPILIWRYLVEQKGINPSDIAVYCDLKFDHKYNPPPSEFILFSGGEDDFSVFTAGNYHHIIFNLGLQEGWDDPACSFAYIDKSMGSNIQIEQVIGRVLRQPGACHYPDPLLNTAHFYIRVDDKQAFPQILQTVRRKLGSEIPEINIDGYSDIRERFRIKKDPRSILTIPQVHIDSDSVTKDIKKIINNMHDYRYDNEVNTSGKGILEKAIQLIGNQKKPDIYTEERPNSNRVMVRWLLRRSIQALYPEVVKAVDWSEHKFNARIEITSPAAMAVKEVAEKLVDVYLEKSKLVFEESNLYSVSSIIINPNKLEIFNNALHDGYSDLNTLELAFARAIDDLGYPWVRNPEHGGFSIPLLESEGSRRFFPDFLVWKDDYIYALDPKGEHLIVRDAGTKLLDIPDDENNQRIFVRLFTKKSNTDGYSVWLLKFGRIKENSFDNINDAVKAALDIL